MQVLVHYHEIALKGGNRPFFVRCLADNLRRATADLGQLQVRSLAGRLVLEAPNGLAWEPLRDRIATVFGVANFGRARRVEPELTALKAAAVEAAQESPAGSFRVTTRRSDKGFPLASMQIDREVGAAVQAATGLRVDLTRPELTLLVEVLHDRIYCSAEKLQGPGGFPVGSSGRVMALLSGGIDSPVAAWRMMKRGCRVLLVHFHAFPLQDHTTIDKARSLARTLARYQFVSRLLLVPFGPAQQAIVAACPAPLRVVLYRRLMLRIAEALAGRYRAKALVTGDSLGQVASQTLDNLVTIDEAAHGPVLRPLVGMDKQEIVEQAQRIGTFQTSTLPDQDCCQLFVPRSPATAARVEEVRAAEQGLDLAGLLSAAVAATEEERFHFPVLQSTAPRARP